MPKYLLIEFDNDRQADALCAQIDAAEEKGKPFRIVGEFKKPTKFCECGHLTENQQVTETARGSRFGWWVHIPCNKPRKMAQSPRNLRDPRDSKRYAPSLSLSDDGLPIRNHPVLEGY